MLEPRELRRELSTRVVHWRARKLPISENGICTDPATLCDFVTGLHEPLNWRRLPLPEDSCLAFDPPEGG